MKINKIEASIFRKPNGTPLCVEILLTPCQAFLPPVVESIDYELITENERKTLIFQLLEVSENSHGR
jgi:hypothetical protein